MFDRERSAATATRPGTSRIEPTGTSQCPARRRPKAIRSVSAFTSGKGGVGTSNLVLNLAIALGEYGRRVVLVDADLGLANIDLLCGLAPACDLGDVFRGRSTAGRCDRRGSGRHPDRRRGPRHADPAPRPGRRPGTAGGRAGGTGVGRRLRADRRRQRSGPGDCDTAARGRSGRASSRRRNRPRSPTPMPRSAGSGVGRPSGRWSTRRPLGPRLRIAWPACVPPAVNFEGSWSSRSGTFEPTLGSVVPSADVDRSCSNAREAWHREGCAGLPGR